MNSQIIRGKITKARPHAVYGSPGVGKTTLATLGGVPEPFFIDGEEGTVHLEVPRILVRSSEEFDPLIHTLTPAALRKEGVRTLVLDPIDQIEKWLKEKVTKKFRVESIGQIRYGNGFNFWREEFDRFLTTFLERFLAAGISILVLGHATTRRIQPPGLREPYDRYEPKLDAVNWHRLTEWCDTLLFYTFDLRLSNTSEGRPIGIGGKQRYLYTQYSPAWEAKSRIALPERIEVPSDLSQLGNILAPLFANYRQRPGWQDLLTEKTEDLSPEALLGFLRAKRWITEDQGITELSDRVAVYLLEHLDSFRKSVAEFAASLAPTAQSAPPSSLSSSEQPQPEEIVHG